MSEREHLTAEDKTRLAAGESDTLPPAPPAAGGDSQPPLPSPDTPAPDDDDVDHVPPKLFPEFDPELFPEFDDEREED